MILIRSILQRNMTLPTLVACVAKEIHFYAGHEGTIEATAMAKTCAIDKATTMEQLKNAVRDVKPAPAYWDAKSTINVAVVSNITTAAGNQ